MSYYWKALGHRQTQELLPNNTYLMAFLGFFVISQIVFRSTAIIQNGRRDFMIASIYAT